MHRAYPCVACLALAAACSQRQSERQSASSWPQQFGTPTADVATSITTDADGNVYVGGFTYASNDGSPPSAHEVLFVVKYSTRGDRLWVAHPAGTTGDTLLGVATDRAGHVYATGSVSSDLFVVKYAPDGSELWNRRLGAARPTFGTALATGGDGDVYVAGLAYATGDGSDIDLLLVKFDVRGAIAWTRQLGGPAWDRGWSVATDARGDVYVAGSTEGSFDGNTSAGQSDALLVKFDAAGTKLWSLQLGTPALEAAWGVATDPTGGVYVVGETYGPLATAMDDPSAQAPDAFLLKVGADGTPVWARQSGTVLPDLAYGVATDARGDVYVTGTTTPLSSTPRRHDAQDAVLSKYSGSGTPLWTRTFGAPDPAHDTGYAVAIGPGGEVYVAGETYGSFEGKDPLGSYDCFVERLDRAGDAR